MNNGIQELIDGIKIYVDAKFDSITNDITTVGIIKGATEDGYSVEVNGVVYDDVDTIGGSCSINETVQVVIPQGQYGNMFILKGGSDSGGGGGTVIVDDHLSTTSINPVQNKVVTNKFNSLSRELTFEEYKKLSEEEKNNGTTYYVKDGGGEEYEYAVVVNMTKSQYESLSDEEKNNGVIYFVND